MRGTWMLGMILVLGACDGRPPSNLDGEPATCAEQPPIVDGGTPAPRWTCPGPVAWGIDTDDRDWLVGCFSADATAHREGGRIVVDEPFPSSYDETIAACYAMASSSPLCFATSVAFCDGSNPCDDPDDLEPRCLYVRAEP